MTKQCSACKDFRSLDEFGKDKSSRDGKHRVCKPCLKARYQQRIEKNRENGRRRQAAFRKRNPAAQRHAHLRRQYGLGLDDFTAMLAAQGGLCAACRASAALCVDHDHATGDVRGLLCNDCNLAVGRLHDDPERARGVLSYIESFRTQPTGLLAVYLGVPHDGL